MEAVAGICAWIFLITLMICLAALCVFGSGWLICKMSDSIIESDLWQSIARTIVSMQEKDQD